MLDPYSSVVLTKLLVKFSLKIALIYINKLSFL